MKQCRPKRDFKVIHSYIHFKGVFLTSEIGSTYVVHWLGIVPHFVILFLFGFHLPGDYGVLNSCRMSNSGHIA